MGTRGLQVIIMSATVKKSFPYLCVLQNNKNKKLRELILRRHKATLDSISELALNILNENLKIPYRDQLKLKRWESQLKKLATEKSPSVRRKILLQGNLLSNLMNISIPALLKII